MSRRRDREPGRTSPSESRRIPPPDPEPAVRPADERRFARVLYDGAVQKLRELARVTRRPLGKASGLRVLIGTAIVIVLLPLVLWIRYKLLYVESQNATVKGYITNVGAQLDGVVTSVEVDEGQPVRAGQVLARFEDHQLQASVQRARSQLDKASRALEVERLAIAQERLRLGGLEKQATARTAAADAQVEAARTATEDARARFDQSKSLADAGAIPHDNLRVAETNLRTSEARELSAHADQNAAQAGEALAVIDTQGLTVRQRNLAVLEAEVAGYRAELALAEADLKAARIVAPADGWVVRRIAEPGTSVVVGQPIAAVWVGPEAWVEAWIDEQDLGKVAVGNPVRVTVKPYPRRVFTGQVETVAVSTDYELPDAAVPQPRNTRLRVSPVVCVRIKLDQPAGLFPGLSAVVAIRKASTGALAATAPSPASFDRTPRPAPMPASATSADPPAAGGKR